MLKRLFISADCLQTVRMISGLTLFDSPKNQQSSISYKSEEFFFFTDIFFGKTYSWMVCRIGESPDYSTEQLVFNLAIDPGELAVLDDNDLAARLTQQPKPVRTLRANTAPAILAYEETPPHLRAGIPDEHVLSVRTARIKNDEHFVERLITAFLSTRSERATSEHVEEQI